MDFTDLALDVGHQGQTGQAFRPHADGMALYLAQKYSGGNGQPGHQQEHDGETEYDALFNGPRFHNTIIIFCSFFILSRRWFGVA
jgi:hypothetical protein